MLCAAHVEGLRSEPFTWFWTIRDDRTSAWRSVAGKLTSDVRNYLHILSHDSINFFGVRAGAILSRLRRRVAGPNVCSSPLVHALHTCPSSHSFTHACPPPTGTRPSAIATGKIRAVCTNTICCMRTMTKLMPIRRPRQGFTCGLVSQPQASFMAPLAQVCRRVCFFRAPPPLLGAGYR